MRKIVKITTFITFFTALLFTLFFTATGCDVGLGSALDIEPPSVKISYPPMGSVIRDWFILSGSCSDDVEVLKVQVQLENTLTQEKSKVYEAEISEDGQSWNIRLNEKEENAFPIEDGNYNILVTAKDKLHSSTDKRQVTIDNHAPVLLLSSPLKLVSDANPSIYGRNIKLAGDIADDNSISSLTFILRDYTNGILSPEDSEISIKVEDFGQMSADNPLLVAKYYTKAELAQAEEETEKETLANYRRLRENYLKLYNNNPAATYEDDDIDSEDYTDKTFLCTVVLNDNALLYQDTSSDEGKGNGNTTEDFYINTTEFYKSLMNVKTYSLTATKLKELFKGKGSYNEKEKGEILETLSSINCKVSSKNISETNALKIQINPDNVPHWKVSGYETGLDESGEPINSMAKNANKGYRITPTTASLFVDLSAGFDNARIDASSVEINLYCMGHDPASLSKDLSSKQTILAKGEWNVDAALKQNYEIPLGNESRPLALESSYYYQIEVSGCDEDENLLVPENQQGYGILVYSGYTAPTLFFKNPDVTFSGECLKNKGFVIEGQITTDDLKLAETEAMKITSLKRTDVISGEEEEVSLPADSYTVTTNGTKPSFTYSIAIDPSDALLPLSGGRYKYVAAVQVCDEKGDLTNEKYTFYVDTKEPVIKIGSSQSRYVRDSIKMEVTVSDSSGIQNVCYSLYEESDSSFENPIAFYPESSSEKTITSFDLGEAESAEITIPLGGKNDSIFTNGKSIVLTVTANDKTSDSTTNQTDKVYANKSTAKSQAFLVDKEAPDFYSDNSFAENIGGTLYSENNWYNQTSLSLIGYWKEKGSGVNEVTASLTPASGQERKSSFGTSAVEGKNGLEKFNTTLSGFEEGSNTIILKAKDKAGNESTSVTRIINIDTKPPVISSEADTTLLTSGSISGNYTFTAGDSNTLQNGSNMSGIKSATVQVGSVKIESGTDTYGSLLFENGNFTFIPNDALVTALIGGRSNFTQTYSVSATVTDRAGNTSASTVIGSLALDCQGPSLTVSSHKENDVVNKTFTLSGSTSDPNKIAAIEIYRDTSLKYTLTSENGYDEESGTWKVNIDSGIFYSLTDTQNLPLRIVARDRAGNESSLERNLIIDQKTDRPLIKLTNLESRSGSSIKSTTVQGTVSDDDGDVKGFWFIPKNNFDPSKLPSDSDAKNWTEIEVESGTGSWSFETAEGPENYFFYVRDGENSTFYSKASSRLEAIMIQGKGDVSASEDYALSVLQGIAFTSDLTPPEVTQIQFTHGNESSSDGNWNKSVNVFGSADKWLYLKVTVKEAVGMKKTGENFTPPEVTLGTNTVNVSLLSEPDYSDGTYTYYLSGINLGSLSLSEGQISVRVSVCDNSGQKGQSNVNIIWDTSAPTVKIISPTTNVSDAVTTSITVSGLMEENYASLKSLYWLIPKKDTVYTGAANEEWNEINASTSWEIKFASGASDSSDSLLYYVSAKNNGDFVYDVSETDTSDSVGNVAVRTKNSEGNDLYVLVDPEGGKPKAWVTSPENGATTSGLVTLYGGSSDNVSVHDVQVQIDADGDGDFDEADYTMLSSITWNDTALQAALIRDARDGSWGITCTGTNSWKIAVATEKLPPYSDGKTYLRARVRAWDEENYTRAWTEPLVITIDSQVPVIKNVKLVQYGAGLSSGRPLTEREYVSGMYISHNSVTQKGEWYLTADISDNVKVSSISFQDMSTSSSAIAVKLNQEEITNDTPTYQLKLKIPTDKTGMIYNTIKAQDDNSGFATQTVQINIDSTAPSLYNTSNAESTNVGTSLRLKSRSLVLGTEAANSTVVNNNGWFTFGDTVKEDGSGLSSILFYFKRNGASETRVYNPMFAEENKTPVSDTKTNGSLYINEDGLAALYISSAERSDEDSLTSSLLIGNKNIRAGGLVKIAGSYSRISSVDLTEGTITFSPTASTSFTEAEIIYAQVVDHQLTESVAEDNSSLVNDDGDEMVESISSLGSSYMWTASLDSTNIPDGPIEICLVAMDNAGNITSGSIATKVENNRPRITKVLLATDLNHNGKFDYKANAKTVTSLDEDKATADKTAFGEFSYYSAINALSGLGQSNVKIASDSFKVKNGLCVIPEFTGGNGEVSCIITNGASDSETNTTGATSALTSKANLLAKINNKGSSSIEDEITDKGGIILASDYGAFSSNGSKYLFFTFWDSTEETNPGTTSQWALLRVPVTVSTTDAAAPVPVIDDFYWKDARDNSVMYDGRISGHIELSDDLPNSFTLGGSGVNDRDAKVSGIITIKGSVSDDNLLLSISMGFGGIFSSTTLANYTNGEWVNTPAVASTSAIKYFVVTDVDVSQEGHLANWTLVVDTEKITGSAGTNKSISISAVDYGSAHTSSAVTKQVDVVPYVTDIITSLSSYSAANTSVYSRNSVGSYVVREGETIQFVGYNLGTNAASVTVNGMSETSLSDGTVNSESVSNTITLTEDSSSGELSLTVSGVPALNNLNKNDAKLSDNDYENAYNRKPNGVNNNTLTDDLKLSVWNFKTAASPIGSSANYVHMKVGPYLGESDENSGRIGFSFKNAIGYFNMPGKKAGSSSTVYTVTNNSVDVYVKSSLGYVAIHHWGNSDKDRTSSPASLGSTVTYNGSSYYHLTFSVSDVLISSDGSLTDLNFLLTKAVGSYTDKTGDCKIPRVGCYVINSAPSGTLTPAEEYRTSRVITFGDSVFSQTRFGTNYGGFNHNTFAFDANGDTYGAAQCPDTSGTAGMSANFQFFSRQVSDESDDYHGLNFNYYNVTNARRIENTSYYVGGVAYTDENRVQNPEMATYVSGSTTYVYLAYYDHGLNQIKFRLGSVGASANTIGLGLVDLDDSTSYCNAGKTGTITDSNGGKGSDANKIAASNSNLRDSTDASYTGHNYVSKIATSGASPYVSVVALNDGTAVVVWYDKSSASLKMKSASFASVTSASVSWSSEKVISSMGGKYVSLAADEAGGLHFAYLSNSGANLYYTYMSGVNASPHTVLVDSYQDVGDRCMITVGRESESSPWVPYISYKSNYASHTKIAYPVEFENALPKAGVNSDETFTGYWNVSLVPSSTQSIEDTISVGVNKSWSNGVMQAFPAGSDSTVSDTGVYSLCDASIVYGNGTKNPVVGYAVEDGSIELGQCK